MTTTRARTTEAATTSAPEPRGDRPERAVAAETERLYSLHHRMVLGLCRALLRDAAEAEDAAQQAFLSAHRSLRNGAAPQEPAAWLATIARNECWARISGRMREPLPADEADTVVAPDDPVAAAIRNADLAALWTAIRALPRSQREALLLREFGGLRYGELAAALAVTEPAVESLLVRARSRLRAQLQAAYASLAPVVRFLVGTGGPAVATKAITLGVGTIAVTSSGLVAPQMLTRHHFQSLPTVASHVRSSKRQTVRRAVIHPETAAPAPLEAPAAAPAPPAPAAPPPAVRAGHEVEVEVEREDPGSRDGGGHDGGSSSDSGTSDGGDG